MKSLRPFFPCVAAALLALAAGARLGAQSCADNEFEAKLISFRTDVLPIRKVGFFAYGPLGGVTPPAKYSTESWSGDGAYTSQDIFSGCVAAYSNMQWNGSWTFNAATGGDASTKALSYHKELSCFGLPPTDPSFSALKISLGAAGSEAGFGDVTSPTSHHYAGVSADTRNVTENLEGLVSDDDAKAYGEAHKTVNGDGLQFWDNFPSADAVQSLLSSGALMRTSPLLASAQRVNFKAEFCVPCLGKGKFRITYYYKKWKVGEPEPAECTTQTEDVEFKDPPYLVPQSGEYMPYHFELKQGEQCKLIKVTARSAEDCAKREAGGHSGANKSVDQFFYLGKRTDGAGAGALAVAATAVSAKLYEPAALQLLASEHADVTVLKQGDVLRQVKAPEAFADIVTLNASSYEIRFYLPAQVGALSGGVYAVSGQPFVTYLVENPDGSGSANRIRFTEQRGSLQKVTLYTYDSSTGTMAMSTGNGLSTEELVRTVSDTTITETRTIKDANDQIVSVVRETKQAFAFSENVTERVLDPAGANLVTSYSYYENATTDGGNYGRVKQMIEPSGRWTRSTYDAQGRAATTVTQYLDSAAGSADSANRLTEVTYGTIADQDGDSTPEKLVTTVQSLLGQEIGRSHEVVFSHAGTAFGASTEVRWSIQCTVAGAAWDDATNLVTKRTAIDSGIWFGKPVSELRPGSTLTTYAYAYAIDSSHVTTTTHSGAANGGGTAVVAGTRVVQVTTRFGQLVSTDVYDYPSNTLLTSDVVSQVDSLGRPTRIDHLDGTHELRSYACCGLDMATDRQGIVTNYNYNALGQVDRETRAGLTQSRKLDPLGRVVSSKRIGSDNSEIVTETHQYDRAGRLAWSKDALNRQTTFSETIDGNGHTIRTTTTPDGGTIVQTYARDGSLLGTDGTAAPQRLAYEYGVDTDGAFTKEIHTGSGGETTEWVKTYSDFAGRGSKRVFAGGAVEQSFYNALGQLVRQADADGVTTLFAYNAKGEQEVTALDLNANGTIDYDGTDRITRTQNVVATHGSYVVQRATIESWETDSANTPVTVSIAESSIDGLRAWQTVRGLSSTSVTVLDGTGGRTVTTTAPDQTVATQVFANDRLQFAVTTRATVGTLNSVSYAYDPHGRLSSTSQLSSLNTQLVTTYTYFNDDQIHTVITPDPDTTRTGDGYDPQTTTYAYDNAGRVNTVTQPDATTVNTTYWPAGQVKRTSGSRTYPTEYAYDSQGRVKTLTTWQDYAGNAGSAVTTWNYTPDRGFLLNKRYADSTGPSYTYKPSGRLLTRTWARGITTTYGYNSAGDLSGTSYSDTTPGFTIGYDRTGRPQTRTDASGTCAWTYDPSSQLKDEDYTTGPLNGLAVHRTFDSLSRLASVSAPSVLSVAYSYDPASRLDTVTAGTNTATYAYVPNIPLVQSVTFKQGGSTRLTTTKAYDNLNRLTSISSAPSAASALNYVYSYNSANQRTQAKREDDSHWDYGYDALGQVNSAVKKLATNTPILGFSSSYTYDDIGNRKTATNNSQLSNYSANLLNQYSSHTVPGSVDVTGTAVADAAVAVDGHSASRQGQNFLYSAAVDNVAAGVWKEFSVAGVRAGGGPGGTDAIAVAERKVWVPKTPEAFNYDVDGNLTSDGRWTYSWDGENRLIAMQTRTDILPPTGHFPLSEHRKLEFAYDLQGRRFSKKVSNWTGSGWQLASATLFLYDGWNLIAEFNAMNANTAVRTYVWGLDLSGSMQGAGGVGGLLFSNAQTANPGTHASAYDGNGNVVVYVDMNSGSKSATYEYNAFGEPLTSDGVAADQLPFRFSTKYTDNESSLLYYGLRYYSPATGRWLSEDPSEEQGGQNLYAFLGNAPTLFIDTDGRQGISGDSWGPWSGMLGPDGSNGAMAAYYRRKYGEGQIPVNLAPAWDFLISKLPETPVLGFSISGSTPIGTVGEVSANLGFSITGNVRYCCCGDKPGTNRKFTGTISVNLYVYTGVEPPEIGKWSNDRGGTLSATRLEKCGVTTLDDVEIRISARAGLPYLSASAGIARWTAKKGWHGDFDWPTGGVRVGVRASVGIQGAGSRTGQIIY